MKKELRVFTSATVANVACGFDIFGFALETPGDEIIVRLKSSSGVTLAKVTGFTVPKIKISEFHSKKQL
jgi:homoserine kinase